MILLYIIVGLSVLNLVRMAALLVIGDIYNLRLELRAKNAIQKRSRRLPTISVIIPAFNEETGIVRTLRSLAEADYPRDKLEVIVVDDGSTDSTAKVTRNYIKAQKRKLNRILNRQNQAKTGTEPKDNWTPLNIALIRQKNMGKAAALNNAIQNHSSGKLIMCLDADSMIDSKAILNASRYFYDKSVAALASNINIIEDGTVLGITQRLEYIIGHHVKKAQTTINIDYIIGGIGSVFRRSVLRKVRYYDTNTMTEDIDLSMKIIRAGNKKYRLVYASNVIAYTEAVPSFRSLVKQRYRWKYGRLQTFFKNKNLFFNSDKKYGRLLTLFVLPNVLLQELIFLLEPVIFAYILWSAVQARSVATIVTVVVVLGSYMLVNIWGSEHLSVKERARLSYYAPAIYFFINIISIVDYLALIRSIFNLKMLPKSIAAKHVTWTSPERRTKLA